LNKFIYREATISDIPFLVDTIIEAERSGTDKLTYTSIFGLTEKASRGYIAKMLAEGIDGCELSISSFVIAEAKGTFAGAVAAWIEGYHGVPSSIAKGNLLRFTLPKSVFHNALKVNQIIHDLHIEYIENTIQIGVVYINKDFRGQKLAGSLIDNQIKKLLKLDTCPPAAYVQVFGNNHSAIQAYEYIGFRTDLIRESLSPDILNYMPFNTKILMKRAL